MSYENKGSMPVMVYVSREPDRSGNYICDGTADDTEIQAAIAYLVASYGGGTVRVCDGVYHMESRTLIPTNISIVGDGVGTRFEKDFDGTEVFAINDANEGQVLSNFMIDGNRASQIGTGIQISGVSRDVLIDNVRVIQCEEYGIEIFNSWGTEVKDSLIEYCGSGIWKGGTGNAILIDGCISRFNDLHAVYFDGGDKHRVINSILEKSQNQYGTGVRANQGNYISIINNAFEDFPANGRCVYIAGTNAKCYGTKIAYNTMSEDNVLIDLNISEETIIIGNNLTGIGTAINIGASSVNTKVRSNEITATTLIVDAGIDTDLPSKSFQFQHGGTVEGTVADTEFVSATASAKGWQVDAGVDWAVALGHLPHELHQIVRIKIWAVALGGPIAAGGQMHLEIVINAGSDNNIFSTEAVALANFDSETTDYVANDVIHWVVDAGDDADIGHMVGGMSIEFKIIYETGADPDGATNAVFRTVEVEYV